MTLKDVEPIINTLERCRLKADSPTREMILLNAKEIIESYPTVDAVSVVHCKECVYNAQGKHNYPRCKCLIGGISDHPTENDYCSRGKRKDEANGVGQH